MSRLFRRFMLGSGLAIFVLGLGSELVLHLVGFGSYPIYDLDREIEYIPAASQHGRFLDRYTWHFNNRHMGNDVDWRPDLHPNVLLVGNSIVLGGLPYDHADKLGPLLEKSLGGETRVWSVAAGGWTSVNEMAYLDRNPDVLESSDIVVLEYMSGGLSISSPWPGYFVFPDHKPLLLTTYLAGKYLPKLVARSFNDFGSLPPDGETDAGQLDRFESLVAKLSATTRVVIFMYPTRKELERPGLWSARVAVIREICAEHAIGCIDLAEDPRWTMDLYDRDGVHPTVDGNKVLAEILAAAVETLNVASHGT